MDRAARRNFALVQKLLGVTRFLTSNTKRSQDSLSAFSCTSSSPGSSVIWSPTSSTSSSSLRPDPWVTYGLSCTKCLFPIACLAPTTPSAALTIRLSPGYKILEIQRAKGSLCLFFVCLSHFFCSNSSRSFCLTPSNTSSSINLHVACPILLRLFVHGESVFRLTKRLLWLKKEILRMMSQLF